MAASPWLLLLLLLLVLPRSARAAVGYGPFFDGCGDNCQTALRIFCTEGLDGAQQRECWCASREYGARMAACLATCDPAVSNVALQREAMLRFRAVVCGGGPAVRDPAFASYYSTRYRGAWKPTPTSAAPPPPVDVMGTLSSGASAASSTSSAAAASTVAATRRRTSSATTSFATQTRAAPSSPSSSTATSTSPSSAPTTTSRRLSTAAIVGVSLGSLAAFTSLLLLGAFLARRHQRSKTPACGAPTTPTQPSSDWPPPSRIQRRESVYYSPDDVGGVGVGVVPEVRVTAATPSVTEIEVEDAEGGGGGGDSACSSRPESSSAGGGSSEWTSDCDDPHEFWDIGFDREGGSPAPPPPDVSPEEEYYRGRYWNGSSSRSSSSSSSYAYCEHPGRRWPDGGGSGVGGGRF